MTPSGFHHHAILVVDLARAEHFYGDVLQLEVVRRWTDDNGQPRSIWFALGTEGAFLAIELASDSRPSRRQGRGHHCFALGISAKERRAWIARLRAAGITIDKTGPHSFYFRDPEGNRLALSHWPEPEIHGNADR